MTGIAIFPGIVVIAGILGIAGSSDTTAGCDSGTSTEAMSAGVMDTPG